MQKYIIRPHCFLSSPTTPPPPSASIFSHSHPELSDHPTTSSSQENILRSFRTENRFAIPRLVNPPFWGLSFKDSAQRRQGLIQRNKSLRENSGTLTSKFAFLPIAFTVSLLNSSFIQVTFIEHLLHGRYHTRVLRIQR